MQHEYKEAKKKLIHWRELEDEIENNSAETDKSKVGFLSVTIIICSPELGSVCIM